MHRPNDVAAAASQRVERLEKPGPGHPLGIRLSPLRDDVTRRGAPFWTDQGVKAEEASREQGRAGRVKP